MMMGKFFVCLIVTDSIFQDKKRSARVLIGKVGTALELRDPAICYRLSTLVLELLLENSGAIPVPAAPFLAIILNLA